MLIVKKFFKLLGLHAICSVGTMLFLMMFPGIIDFGLGEFLFSLLALMVFFDLFYTAAWEMSNKEVKHIKIYNNHLTVGQQPRKMRYTNGIILAASYGFFGLVLWLLTYIFGGDGSLWVFAFRIWFCEYIVAFTHSVRHIWHVYLVVALSPAVFILLGYFCGAKNITFMDNLINKIVYKSKKDTKNKSF